MSSIYRIKANQSSFTETEKRIAAFILANNERVIHMSSQELAQHVNTSAAAIVRFSKTVGYSGFTELKVELAKASVLEESDDFDALISEDDSIAKMIEKAQYANNRTLEQTYKLIDSNRIGEVVEVLKQARKIFIFGIGASGLVAQDLYQKFIRINVEVVYLDDFHLAISALTFATSDDAIVLFSYSGQTKEMRTALDKAMSNGVTSIAITQTDKNDLAKNADYKLSIPNEETELRLGSIASRNAMLVVSDLIYLGYAKADIEATRERLVETRRNVHSLRNK